MRDLADGLDILQYARFIVKNLSLISCLSGRCPVIDTGTPKQCGIWKPEIVEQMNLHQNFGCYTGKHFNKFE